MKKNIPVFVLGAGLVYILGGLKAPRPSGSFDVGAFSRLPVLNGGRIKPMDTVARTSLLLLRGKQTVRLPGKTLSASEWLLDMLYRARAADAYPVFEIDDPDVLGGMGIRQTKNRHFSFNDLRPHLAEIENQAHLSEPIQPQRRTRYQTAVGNLQNRLVLYQKLQNTLQVAGEEHVLARRSRDGGHAVARYEFMRDVAEFHPIPVSRGLSGMEWVSAGQGLLDSMRGAGLHPAVGAYAALGDAWRASDAAAFNGFLAEYRRWLQAKAPVDFSRAGYEFRFNQFEPFSKSMALYAAVFLLAVFSFLFQPRPLARSAFWLLVPAFGVHSAGLLARMVLQGRPPVTNLYSSAIFVGWGAVLLGIVVERLARSGVGSLVASAIGALTLIIAHHLAASGDTLEMMRAVLDSNFWLATHVTTITIGYSSTLLSGLLAAAYLARRVFDRRWNEESARALERMVYGVVCFSVFFSFIGTILGGIWADQSWGRFWGWDPKENGALMIVLWNVLILHARLGGLASPRAVMILAVFGNIVTAFSWFGVNMLGVGLHAYGFMDKAFVWLVVFTVSQILVMGLGFLKGPARPLPLPRRTPR